jgi:hypothetical protein
MRAAVAVLACLAVLAPPALAQAPQPPKPTKSTDAEHCRWRWWSGALPMGGSIGAWTEYCEFATGVWELDYTADLPGFWLTIDGEEQVPVIQVFAKPADADIAAILPELRERGYIPDDDECGFAPAMDSTLMTAGPAPRTRALFEIMPTGSRLAALEATPDDEIPEPPCGEYGWSTQGTRYFVTDVAHPDKVIYIDIGQDGMMFDQTSVSLVE